MPFFRSCFNFCSSTNQIFAWLSQQVGGEIADFFIVPRNTNAITTLSGKAYLSALVLVLLLAMLEAEVDFHAGDGYAKKEVRSEIDNEFRDTYSDLICWIANLYL